MSTPLPGNSVIDKMRASGMTDDQIMSAIINFGRSQEPSAVPVPNGGTDTVSQLRTAGYTDDQITAQVVASADAANHAGSGDPTAAGGILPDVATLAAQLDTHAGTVQNVEAAHAAHAERIGGLESDVNDHGDTLTDHTGRLERLENAIREIMRDRVSDSPATEGNKA